MPVDFDEIHGPNPMEEVMGERGITRDYLARKLKAELNAKKNVVHYEKADPEKGLTSGGFYYSKNLIDWGTRQRARMDAHKLLGDYPTTRHKLDITRDLSDDELDARINGLLNARDAEEG